MSQSILIPVTIAILASVGFATIIFGLRSRSKILQKLWLPKNSKSTAKRHLSRIILFSVATLCLLVILIAPNSQSPTAVNTAHIAFLPDVSYSMAAERPLGSPNRLQRSKALIEQTCDAFPEIHTSLYAFSGIARSHAYFSESPSYKHNCGYIKKTLQNVLKIESTAKKGSDIADALIVASSSFPQDAEMRILVLFTDGEYTNQDKKFVQAFSTIKKREIYLIVVGVGEENGAYIPIYDNDSGEITHVERDLNGIVVTALRSETLQTIANEVNGKYFRETQQSELFAEIEARLIEKEEPLENFYSSWKIAPMALFFLAGLLFLRSVL
jgi:hypothetical protein